MDKINRNITEEELLDILYGYGVDSYNRLETFIKLCSTLPDELYWVGLREAYMSSDNLFTMRHIVRACFKAPRESRERLMEQEERETLNRLPDNIEIYRAMVVKEDKSKQYGISWTLSKKTAEFFKNEYFRNFATYNQERIIKTITIPKSKVIAYLNGRQEQEIIYINEL